MCYESAPGEGCLRSRGPSLRLSLVEALGQGVPREGGALDAHGELHHALKGLEVAELDVGLEADRLLLLAAVEALLVDRHHGLEGPDHAAGLLYRLALDRRGHHRRRRLTDGAALAGDLDVGDDAAVADVEVDHDLVAAEGVEAFHPAGGGRGQLAAVAGVAVVIEDDLSVEVFEARHRSVDQMEKSRSASSSASLRASTSASSL